MENLNLNFPSDEDLKNVVKELREGREIARQLQVHLISQSPEIPDYLLHKILASYDHALTMLHRLQPHKPTAVSPRSDDSDLDGKDPASRKRKGMARWTEKVRVYPGSGIEGQLDDGYGWRKYGQKDILGAKHPRGYYRCTHRHGQGCLATKQVQRSDEDPNTYLITYRRNHTCNPPGNSTTHNPDEDPDHPLPEIGPILDIQTGVTVIDPNNNNNGQTFNFSSSDSQNNNFLGDFYFQNSQMGNDLGELIPNLRKNSDQSELSPIVSATSGNFPVGSSGMGQDFSFGFYP